MVKSSEAVSRSLASTGSTPAAAQSDGDAPDSGLSFDPKTSTITKYFIEDDRQEAPDQTATSDMLRARINDVLKTLTYREREILKLRYGIGDGYTYTLEEVGRIFKVTRERVRQVESKAIRKLQHPVRLRRLSSFIAGMETAEQA